MAADLSTRTSAHDLVAGQLSVIFAGEVARRMGLLPARGPFGSEPGRLTSTVRLLAEVQRDRNLARTSPWWADVTAVAAALTNHRAGRRGAAARLMDRINVTASRIVTLARGGDVETVAALVLEDLTRVCAVD